ncbi:MAG: hypothetical protein K2M69_02070 [Muribaculaceae bacterium]|nr:hypothetical protein [Muribaculaceae bacterium]
MSREEERIRRLAKAWAVNEGETVALYINADGTYGFTSDLEQSEITIVEFLTPY